MSIRIFLSAAKKRFSDAIFFSLNAALTLQRPCFEKKIQLVCIQIGNPQRFEAAFTLGGVIFLVQGGNDVDNRIDGRCADTDGPAQA